jgi:hypothetical protein
MLTPKAPELVQMIYWNSDGSMGALCGNAALCSGRLAVHLELVQSGEFGLLTDAGMVRVRATSGRESVEIKLPDFEAPSSFTAVSLEPGERWMSLVTVGVPHLVIRTPLKAHPEQSVPRLREAPGEGDRRMQQEAERAVRKEAEAAVGADDTKYSLGSVLNGVLNYNSYVPGMKYPGIEDFLSRYAKRAAEAKVDPLGFYLPPFNYAIGQILEQAINATKSFEHKALAGWLRKNEVKTIVGPIRWDKNGEWANPRVVQAQFRGVVDKDIEQFRKPGKQVVIYPEEYKTGDVITPFEKARSAK